MITKIGYNLVCKTAKQQYIIEGLSSAKYYENRFKHVLTKLEDKLMELGCPCAFEIQHNSFIRGTDVYHSIVYVFHNKGQFNKVLVKCYIQQEYNKKLTKLGYNETI